MLKTVGFPSTRTGDQTIIAGNLIIGTGGKGIDFSADPSAPGMTSELLDDYEEGTWTPVVAESALGGIVATGTFTGTFTKIGRMVTVNAILIDITTTGMKAVETTLTLAAKAGPMGYGTTTKYLNIWTSGS